jgi:hypothetical protein
MSFLLSLTFTGLDKCNGLDKGTSLIQNLYIPKSVMLLDYRPLGPVLENLLRT